MIKKQNEDYHRNQSTFICTKNASLENQNVMLMDTAEALVDAVTPYAIRNLTNYPILVASLKDGADHSEGESKICEGEVKGLAVSFAETLNMSERDTDGKKQVVSKD